jgi:hypothetical protein
MAKKAEVLVGQEYREPVRGYLGGFGRRWRVESVGRGIDGQLNAVISSVDLTHTTKTLSAAVLLDRKRYELVSDPVPHAA